MEDVIVEQTRQIRRELEQQFDHDPQKYLEHVYEAQKRHGPKLVCRQPQIRRRRKAI